MKSSYRLVSLLDMYQIDASAFFESAVILRNVTALVERMSPQTRNEVMSRENAKASQNMLSDQLSKAIEPLNVPVTKLTVRDLLKELDESNITYNGCGQLIVNLGQTLQRELESSKVFALDANRVNFYEPLSPLFGPDVDNKFPSLIGEIKEAGKCYCPLPLN